MTVAQSHYYSPSDRLSSSSSPDNHAASRFTPDDSSSNNDDDYRGGEGMGISTTNLQMTSDNIEAYELRDIVVGRSTTKDFSDDEEDDDDDNDKSSEEFEIGGDLENDQNLVYTAEEERTVVRKFDRRLVLFVALLYMLSFLDRSNIGNAYTAGMDEDLLQTTDPLGTKHGGSSSDYYYEWALTAFYLAYIAFEWLSLLWTVIPAHIYVSGIVLSWGVIASLQSVAGSYPWLIRLRFLLGIGEAGFTGIPIYLSFFFRRDELALRTAVFISAAPLATTFASSLAWVITKLGENGPIAPWRLLFLVEGFPAVIVATLAWRIIPDSPGQARYLTKREKQIARHRLLVTGTSLSENKGKKSTNRIFAEKDDDYDDMDSDCTTRFWQSILVVLLDPVPWTTAAIFFLTNVAYSSLPVFLPFILTQMGHSALASQALAAPPYLFSFIVVLAVAAVSDALQSRTYFIAASALLSAGGYTFLALSETIGKALGSGGMLDMIRYLAVYPATAGFFCVVVLTISLNINNARGDGHKGGGFVLMQVLGQCGPLIGTRLFPKTDGPWFTKGMGICAGSMLGVAVLAMALRWHLARRNRQLDAEEDGGDSEEEEELVGANSDAGYENKDSFRYML